MNTIIIGSTESRGSIVCTINNGSIESIGITVNIIIIINIKIIVSIMNIKKLQVA